MKLTSMNRRGKGVLRPTIVVLILILTTLPSVGSVAAAAAPPDAVIDLPMGTACPDFSLRIEIRGSNKVVKDFKDENGNVVRTLTAGKGSALSFINLSSRATFSLKANGAVAHTRFNPDGSSTVAITGHNVLILFPLDIPAGPSTTLHVGRVVYTVDPNGVFTVQKVSGKRTDICAILSA